MNSYNNLKLSESYRVCKMIQVKFDHRIGGTLYGMLYINVYCECEHLGKFKGPRWSLNDHRIVIDDNINLFNTFRDLVLSNLDRGCSVTSSVNSYTFDFLNPLNENVCIREIYMSYPNIISFNIHLSDEFVRESNLISILETNQHTVKEMVIVNIMQDILQEMNKVSVNGASNENNI